MSIRKINANYFIRHIEIGNLMETFFVMAVVSLLVLSAGLHVFNYPLIGTETLHIAHVLWGGFLMFFGLVVAMVLLNKEARYMGAVLGGVGFGVFIDELGKFITHDNDYFYRPAFAIIYIIFVILFFLFRMIERAIPPSSQEYMINAIELVKDAVVHDLDTDEQQKALELLKLAGTSDPVVRHLQRMIEKMETIPPQPPHWFKRSLHQLSYYYTRLIAYQHVASGVIGYFAIMAVLALLVSVFQVDLGGFWIMGLRISALVMTLAVVWGSLLFYRRRRLQGYGWYRYAVMVALFFFQFFLVYFQPMWSLAFLVISLMTLVVLNYAIYQEELENVHERGERGVYRWFKRVMRLFVVKG